MPEGVFQLVYQIEAIKGFVFWTLDNTWCVYLSACFLVTLSKRGWVFACIVVALVFIHNATNYSQVLHNDCIVSISLKISLSQITEIKPISVGS